MSPKILLDPKKRSKHEEYIYSQFLRFMVGHEETLRRFAKELSLLKILNGAMRSVDKPASRGIFLGCTGSGKTYLVQVISMLLFNDFDGAIKISGGDLSQEHQLSKLLGAPHGYIGFDRKPLFTARMLNEAGYLASIKADPVVKFYSKLLKKLSYAYERQAVLRDAIRNPNISAVINSSLARQDYQEANNECETVTESINKWTDTRDQIKKLIPGIDKQVLEIPPYNSEVGYPSIAYIDEIEKAHSGLYRILLEWLDKGRFTTTGAYGETISFKNTLLYMTSNIGQKEMLKIIGENQAGFQLPRPTSKKGLSEFREEIRHKIFKATYEEFKKVADPEFIGRVGTKRIYTFIPPSREDQYRLIKDIMLPRYNFELKQVFPVEVSMTKEVCNYILDQASSSENIVLGIRPVVDLFESEIKSEIISLMARPEEEGGIIYGDKISIELDAKQRNLNFFLTKRSKKNHHKLKNNLEEIAKKQQLISEGGGLCEFVFDYQSAA